MSRANGPPASPEDGVCHNAHKADRGAAVDETYAVSGQRGAEGGRGGGERGAISEARPAEDGDVTQWGHRGSLSGGAAPGKAGEGGAVPPCYAALSETESACSEDRLARPRRTMVFAASLSWMVRENTVPARAKAAAAAKAR